MSRTKKAVIIGSVLVGIGVIIGFIGIAIGGFKFPNGAVDLTTMKALHTEKKTVQIADAFDKIEIAGASSMDIEICKSKTGKNYVEYYDTDDWTSHVDVKDHVLNSQRTTRENIRRLCHWDSEKIRRRGCIWQMRNIKKSL